MEILCKHCQSIQVVRNGYNTNIEGERSERYLCRTCGKSFTIQKNDVEIESINKIPNVLLLDIETLPMEVYVWGLYKQRINPDNVIQDWSLLSWAAKWLFHNEIESEILTPKEAVARNDLRITEKLWTLIEKADIIIAHNGVNFDIRGINARFILNGLSKPSPYQVIDTLTISRRMFKFSSHKLDYLGKIMANKRKIETDFQLWIDCLKGKKESLDYMQKYNIEDVNLLEEVYLELRGWMPSHPNMSLYAETTKELCPICLSKNITSTGDYVTQASIFTSMRCNNCGGIFRKRNSVLGIKQKNLTYIPLAR